MGEIAFRVARDGEREPLLELLDVAFDQRELMTRYLDAEGVVGLDDSWVALDGGRLVASVQIFEKTIRLRGHSVAMGGIGSVATHPDYERRGIATELLRRAIEDMRRRGHLLSLLFTSRISFYQRLDWLQIIRPFWSLRRPPRVSVRSRPFEIADLERIRRIYDYYNLRGDTSVVRDDAYWRAQLRYAGTPEEDFRVVERNGKIVAYARRIDFEGMPRITEHGCAPDGRPELGALLGELAPDSGALLAHRTADPELADVLHRSGMAADPIDWGDNMWRVIDRPALLEIADLSDVVSNETLLRELVGGESAVFWASDRF